MGKIDLEAMDFEELWLLHEELTKILSEKITAEKLELEKRLAQLRPTEQVEADSSATSLTERPRRKYAKVLPKYFNPTSPGETWSGRGKQPRWIVAALQSGHKLEEFRIDDSSKAARKSRRSRQP